MTALPLWVKNTTSHAADPFLATWLGHRMFDNHPQPACLLQPSAAVPSATWQALSAEQPGKHADPDLLSVSFSPRLSATIG